MRQQFFEVMDHDLNTPEALAVLDQLANYGYQLWRELESLRGKDPKGAPLIRGKIVKVVDVIQELAGVLDLSYSVPRVPSDEENELFARYSTARKRKDFQTSDEIRGELARRGFEIQDTSDGSLMIPKR